MDRDHPHPEYSFPSSCVLIDSILSIRQTANVASMTKPTDVWTRFAMSIFRVNGLLIRAGEGITQPIGQSSARWQVLGRAYEPRTVAAIARDIGHARQSVQRIADVLEGEGLVGYSDNAADRRARLLQLTPEGMEVLNAIYLRQVEWSLKVMTGLDSDQLLHIAECLGNIATVLDADIEARTRSK